MALRDFPQISHAFLQIDVLLDCLGRLIDSSNVQRVGHPVGGNNAADVSFTLSKPVFDHIKLELSPLKVSIAL